VEFVAVSRREGAEARDTGGLTATKAGDDVVNQFVQLVSGNGGWQAGGAGETADQYGLFHGAFRLTEGAQANRGNGIPGGSGYVAGKMQVNCRSENFPVV
jgi:hypothetical protein